MAKTKSRKKAGQLVRVGPTPLPPGHDPYLILGVKKSASTDQITRAYRRLAKDYHPDRGGNPDDFKRVQWAYEVLIDPARRKVWDLTGKDKGSVVTDRATLVEVLPVILFQVLEQLADGGVDVTKVDLIPYVKRGVKDQIDNKKVLIGSLKKGIKTVEKVVGRFKSTDEFNLFELATRRQLDNLKRTLEDQEKDLTRLEYCGEYLKSCSYDYTRGGPARAADSTTPDPLRWLFR